MPHSPLWFWSLFKTALQGWWDDRALTLGAALAFYTLFALAPVLLTAIALAGLFFGPEAAQGAIVAEIGGLIGLDGARAIEDMIVSARDPEAGIIGATVGIVSFFILSTGVFVELQDALNLIWKVKSERHWGWALIRGRFVSFAIIVVFGFLLLVSLVLDASLTAVAAYLGRSVADVSFVLKAANFLLALAGAVVLFAFIFKVLPDIWIPWRDVWVGAFFTGFLFTIGKLMIGFYLGKSGVASSYGAAASVITILLWIYYSSQILLFGAEFTKAYSEMRLKKEDAEIDSPRP